MAREAFDRRAAFLKPQVDVQALTQMLTSSEQLFAGWEGWRQKPIVVCGRTMDSNSLAASMRSRDTFSRPQVEQVNGTINQFTDINGNKYRLQDGKYINPENFAQVKGVDLQQQSDGSIEIRDRETGIKRTTTPDGLETTDYASTGGGRVIRAIEGKNETLIFEDSGGRKRSMTLERNERGAVVSTYTDGAGIVYEQNNGRENGKPIYTAKDCDGRILGSRFTIMLTEAATF